MAVSVPLFVAVCVAIFLLARGVARWLRRRRRVTDQLRYLDGVLAARLRGCGADAIEP